MSESILPLLQAAHDAGKCGLTFEEFMMIIEKKVSAKTETVDAPGV